MTADRSARTIALAALALGTGCSSVCKGPGCSSAYDAERLSVWLWSDDLGRRVDLDDADHTFAGTEIEGTNWVVRPGPPGTIWIGMPDANQVVRVPNLGDLTPDLVVTGTGRFGATLEVMDLDGDGARELVVGAPEYELAVGAVFVFNDTGPQRTGTINAANADLAIVGTSSSDHFGARLFPCADLTGDERPELAVSAPWLAAPPGSTESIPNLAGGVFLIRSESLAGRSGVADPWDLGPVWYGMGEGDGAGRAVSCRADFTSDRRADVAIGAPFATNPNDETAQGGLVYLIETDGNAAELGQASLPDNGPLGVVATNVLVPPAGFEDGFFGGSLASMDVDRVAPVDLVVGAPGADRGSGRVAVYLGASLLDSRAAPAHTFSPQRSEPDHFGQVLKVRDLNGDSLDDLFVGVPDWYGGGNAYDTGRLFIWDGASSAEWGPSLTISSARWQVQGEQPFQRVGARFEILDADQDGIRDLYLPTHTEAPDL